MRESIKIALASGRQIRLLLDEDDDVDQLYLHLVNQFMHTKYVNLVSKQPKGEMWFASAAIEAIVREEQPEAEQEVSA